MPDACCLHARAADVNTLKVPSHLPDEKVIFLSDIMPTGWNAAEMGNVSKGDRCAKTGALQVFIRSWGPQPSRSSFSPQFDCKPLPCWALHAQRAHHDDATSHTQPALPGPQ